MPQTYLTKRADGKTIEKIGLLGCLPYQDELSTIIPVDLLAGKIPYQDETGLIILVEMSC